MIIRTYQRRNRIGRSLSENGLAFGDELSGSQDSPWGSSHDGLPFSDPTPFGFPSSQESFWLESEYGNTSLSQGSSRRPSCDEHLRGPSLSAISRKPPLARSVSDRPSVTSDKKISPAKTHRAQNSFPGLYDNGTSKSRASSRVASKGVERDLGNVAGSSRWEKGAERDGTNQWGLAAPPTSTLMEAQESGEMMEHVDEVNFAMDGLRFGQPLRVQRASLTSLLSLCGSMHKRRLLRTQGMAKPLMEAIVALPTDDSPLALAAAAVLYFLASDSHDEDLLDSPPCVRFLMKLLGAILPEPKVKKGLSSIGSKLAALGAKCSLQKLGSGSNSSDGGGAAVVAKVRALFRSTEGQGSSSGILSEEKNGLLQGEEISSKLLALLTLEKACLSTVVLEDSTGESLKKVGGRFKERLRELGGLDAICDLASRCLRNLTDAIEAEDSGKVEEFDFEALERSEKSGGAGVLLRCLRVMENVTFLSEQNQKHLLEVKLSQGKNGGPGSFIALTIHAIKTLSGKKQISLNKFFENTTPSPINDQAKDGKVEPPNSGKNTSLLITFQRRKVAKLSVNNGKVEVTENNQKLSVVSMVSDGESSPSLAGETDGKLNAKAAKGTMKVKVSLSSNEVSQQPDQWDFTSKPDNDLASKLKMGSHKRKSPEFEDSQDPYAYGDIDLDFKVEKPPRAKVRRGQAGKGASVQIESHQARVKPVEDDDAEFEKLHAAKGPSSEIAKEHYQRPREALFEDCLLSAVRVLMNLTNDNPVGCRQVATSGGLITMASLLMAHYPWQKFSSLRPQGEVTPLKDGNIKDEEGTRRGSTEGQTDQDMDILVVVLGMLCNLVEKDIGNRVRLATLNLVVPANIAETKEGMLWQESGMISLLCSLFLSKQGAGEAVEAVESKRESGIEQEMDTEATLKQGRAEAEDMIVEAYAALLLGFLSKESERARSTIAELLSGEGLTVLVPVLERFVAFHLSLNMISTETHRVVRDVIDSLKKPILSRPVT